MKVELGQESSTANWPKEFALQMYIIRNNRVDKKQKMSTNWPI